MEYYYSDREGTKHLRDYWQVILKRLRYMVPIFCGTVALGFLITIFSPTLYTARSTLKIEPQSPSFTGVAEAPNNSGSDRYDYYQTQYALLSGAPLAARVIKTLGLQSNPALTTSRFNLVSWVMGSVESALNSIAGLFQTQSTSIGRGRSTTYELGVAPALIGRYRSFLKIEPVKNTRLVDVSFSTPDPRLSQELANNHATAFIQMILENRFNLTQEARDFLQKKLAELRGKVVRAENELNTFRQKHGVVSMEKGENIV